jgi:3-keto-disaccharide hydrolase
MRAALLLTVLIATALLGQRQERTSEPGYSDTPYLPDGKWRVHDIKRPHPRSVTPGNGAAPPSDAVVLFDGKNLSKWTSTASNRSGRPAGEPRWKVVDGYVEILPGGGDLVTKEKFGDCQLHIEWASPAAIDGSGQWRGNSGVILMSRYEIQVLDSWNNLTYADGQAGAIYGQYPPLVNASRKPGEWQSFDIVFEAPNFEAGKVAKPAYATVFHNGVLVHHRQALIGQMAHKIIKPYEPHGPEEPFMLQDHDVPVRYRNIWIRRLTPYDVK